MTRLELHRPVPLERIGATGYEVLVEATPEENAALARRLAIPAVRALRCWFVLRSAPGEAIAAEGRLEASVVRTCVVSLEDFDAMVHDSFSLRFVPEGRESDDPDPESEDEVPYRGETLDLGEAAAQQLALALDPYPRRPEAELPIGETPATDHPFAKLAARRRLN